MVKRFQTIHDLDTSRLRAAANAKRRRTINRTDGEVMKYVQKYDVMVIDLVNHILTQENIDTIDRVGLGRLRILVRKREIKKIEFVRKLTYTPTLISIVLKRDDDVYDSQHIRHVITSILNLTTSHAAIQIDLMCGNRLLMFKV